MLYNIVVLLVTNYFLRIQFFVETEASLQYVYKSSLS